MTERLSQKGSQPTYEELKLQRTWQTYIDAGSSQPTYEELKQCIPAKSRPPQQSSQPTYEELKRNILNFNAGSSDKVLSLPMRN